jgi:pyruvate/oxaloacetate carboxyltransferase
MTKKEFFLQKIIPQVEEQIFVYDFQLIRNQYLLERLNKELEAVNKSLIVPPGANQNQFLKEREKKMEELQKEIEKVKENIAYLPLMKAEEEEFLKYLKTLVEKM